MVTLLSSLATTEPSAPLVARTPCAVRPPRALQDFSDIQLRDLALDRIQQGLCVFDGQQRLLLFNRRYAEMYHLDPAALWPGMTLRDVVDARYRAGTGPDMSPAEYAAWRDRIGIAGKVTDSEVVLRNGDVHAIHHEPITGGGWVATFTDITSRRRAEERVRYMAHHDALTCLPNRALFFERLEAIGARLRGEECFEDHRPLPARGACLVAVLFLDLDNFKDVNDTLGHAAGDELLRQVATRIKSVLRHDETLARLGGDEFAILLDGTAIDEAQVAQVASRVIRSVAAPFALDGHEALIGTSIGIALCCPTDDHADPAVMLRQADLALYRAKAQQRGTACFFRAEMDVAAVGRCRD